MLRKKILRGIAGTSVTAILVFGLMNIFSYLRIQESLMEQYRKKSGELYQNYQQSMERVNSESIEIITKSYEEYLEAQLEKHVERLDIGKRNLERMYQEQTETQSVWREEEYYLQPNTKKEQVEPEFGVIKGILDILKLTSDMGNGALYYVSESGMLLSGQKIDYENSNPESDRRQRDWYRETKKSKELYWQEMYIDNWSGEKIVTCAKPVLGADGSIRGIIAEDITISYMEDILKKTGNELVKYAYVCDADGTMFLSSDNHINPLEDMGTQYGKFRKEMLETEGTGIYMSQDCMVGYASIKETDWHVCVVLDYERVAKASREIQEHIGDFGNTQEKALQMHLANLLVMSITIILVLLAVVLIISRRTSNSIAQPIQLLTRQAERIGRGELEETLEEEFKRFDSKDEVGILADTICTMTMELRQYIKNLAEVTADKERIATELSIANQIQAGMLPCIFPPFPEREEFEIFASMHPAKEVGGDFYDFFLIDENHLCVVIADVSGKGVPAALFMVIAKTLIKNYAGLIQDVGEVFEIVNNQLCENNEAGMFVTAFLGVLDIRTGSFDYVNAGHNPPLLLQKGKSYEWLQTDTGFVLAGIENMKYEKQNIKLYPGDTLFLYTDGVTEAVNNQMELYGEERTKDTLNREELKDKGLNEIMGAIQLSLKEFSAGAMQADDITMLMLRIKEVLP